MESLEPRRDRSLRHQMVHQEVPCILHFYLVCYVSIHLFSFYCWLDIISQSAVSLSYLLSLSLAYQECHSTALLHWLLLQATSTRRYPRNSRVPQPTFPSPPLQIFKSTQLAISFLSHSTISMLKYGIPPVISKSDRVTLEKRRFLHVHSQSSKSRSIFLMSRQMIRILHG